MILIQYFVIPGNRPHRTRGTVVVDFIGVNRPPQFEQCQNYKPTLIENQGEGATVLEV